MINYREKHSTQYIENISNLDENKKRNIKILDENYDFSNFLSHGRSFYNLIEALENEYDEKCFKTYGIYLFDYLNFDDLREYFCSRYNIYFQEYLDWVVRHEDGTYEKARRRA